LNVTLPFIRTDFTGDWSGFTGRVNATTTNSTQGDFRLGHTYPMPAAAFNLGPKVHFMTTVIVPATGLELSVGELAGNTGSFFKGGPTITGPVLTYTVGERNTDATFSGIITEQAVGAITAIRKSGTGTWTLNAANTYKGKTTVAGGTLRLASPGSITNTSPTEVLAGGTLRMAGGTLSTASVLIQAGGILTGPGTVAGTVTNHGTILGDTTGTPTFTGSIVNHGTIRLTGGASITATGTITNHGVFDKITGAATLPPRFINLGVVLDSSLVRVKESRIEAGHFIATIASHTGHGYRLQRNDSLAATGWQDVGPTLAGTGAVLQLSDPLDPARVSRFYRIKVDP
jgi:autotransporter-associated beta strand protein